MGVYMVINQKLLKPITEVSYLRAENVARYRVIIRYFYEEYEKIKYMLHPEDIFNMMKQTGIFDDYTEALCQNDLDALVEWGNLISMQDSSKVTTLEEFTNRKYRYQLSEYTVEIERMTQTLENLEIEGASLEPTLLERIRENLWQIDKMIDKPSDVIYSWWNNINDDFMKLNRNYQDYIRELNGINADEMLMSKEFVLFKDRIVQYLRTFVKGLQEEGIILENFLKDIDANHIKTIMRKTTEHAASIPTIGHQLDETKYLTVLEGKWQNIYNWFVPTSSDSEINRMSDITLETIRKITRYAQQIGEFYHRGSNRKEEYRHLVRVFGTCNTLEDAHKLSAIVFGVEQPLSLKGVKTRETESIQSGVFDESPTFYEKEARSRIRIQKRERIPAQNYELEKRMQMQEIIDEENKKKSVIQNYIQNQVIDFQKLPKIEAHTRKTLLYWLSKGLADKDLRSRTEWGQYFTVDKTNADLCILKCEDGDMEMPAYRLIFEGGLV